MSNSISRRAFVSAASVAALGLGLAGCASNQQQSNIETETSSTDLPETGLLPADETVETEVLVVGLGASGIMAATAAGREGAQVLAIDVASDINGTGNINTTAPSVFGSNAQAEANPDNVTSAKDAYQFLLEQTHYQENSQVLLPMLERSALCADTMVEYGMPFMFTNTLMPAEASINDKTGAIYLVAGEERGAIWEAMLEGSNVETRFGTQGSQLIFDEEGTVCGVQCKSGDQVIDIYAQRVVLCTGASSLTRRWSSVTMQARRCSPAVTRTPRGTA